MILLKKGLSIGGIIVIPNENILSNFAFDEALDMNICTIEPIVSGHINHTFVLEQRNTPVPLWRILTTLRNIYAEKQKSQTEIRSDPPLKLLKPMKAICFILILMVRAGVVIVT